MYKKIKKLSQILAPCLTALTMVLPLPTKAFTPPQNITSDNLDEYEFQEPMYTEKQLLDRAKYEFDEQNEAVMQKAYEKALDTIDLTAHAIQIYDNKDITVEIYQNSSLIKKQFMVVKEEGEIRYVFVISAAGKGKVTPSKDNPYEIRKQLWRHMSTLYPSKGENNMDFVSYFNGPIGFHSTVFGLYSKLGKADSHGCVRMGRPEARAVYALIKKNLPTTKVYSFNHSENPLPGEIDTVKNLLAMDVSLVQYMLKNSNNGDVPKMSESDYFAKKAKGTLDAKYIEISPEQDNLLSKKLDKNGPA
jgi:lipoprotein-anchoring transpeptidase ErfK/SrfK